MEYAAERTLPRSEPAADQKRGVWQILRHYATPKVTAAAIIWRFESYTVTPLVIFCIEAFGRWEGAFVVGCIMSVYSAIFLHLLEGERALDALRDWLRERRMVRRVVLPVKNSEGLVGVAGRWFAAPASVMLLAAFAALPRDGASWDRTAALEVYRGYSEIEHALLRVADRTWYAVLRAM